MGRNLGKTRGKLNKESKNAGKLLTAAVSPVDK
jgi:hypothetical protein